MKKTKIIVLLLAMLNRIRQLPKAT